MIRLYDILKDIFSQREYKKTMFEDRIGYNIFSEEYAFRHLSREIDYDIFWQEHPDFLYFQTHFNKISWRRYKKYCQKILSYCFPVWCHHTLVTVAPLTKLTGQIFNIKVQYSGENNG